MSKVFDTYEEAYFHASTGANKLQIAHGIERTKEFNKEVYRVSLLPANGKRFGWELRCEAVEVGSPILYGPAEPPAPAGR